MHALFVSCVLSGALVVGGSAQQTTQQEEIAALQRQRIDLLQERVDQIRQFISLERARPSELQQPTLDLLTARLEYAITNEERQQLLREIIALYDEMIEEADARKRAGLTQPATPDNNEANELLRLSTDLLFLRSERVRFQILLTAIE
jgi:hypothetical protein